MYKLEDVGTIHLEITTKCNASCPMCLRTIMGGQINPQLPITELTLEEVKTILPRPIASQLKRLYMCGNYGDPALAKDTLEVFAYLRAANPQIRLEMFSNGGVRPPSWWAELAKIINNCRFAIDGLEDTNHIYRRGTVWKRIMENVSAFIQAGGRAQWEFIVFAHNEHQIEDARELSQQMGFSEFLTKKTGRFFSNQKSATKQEQMVFSKRGEAEYTIKNPTQKKYQNKALLKEEELTGTYGTLENYFNKTKIDCKVAKEKSLYISAEGFAFPCCWLGNQLYPWYFKPQSSQVWKMLDQLGGVDAVNVKRHSLQNVVEGDFFQKLVPDSWQKQTISGGRLKTCAKTCGVEFDPFSEQFR